MSKIQAIVTRLRIQGRDSDGQRAFHSDGMLGISLVDLIAIEREIRREIANEISHKGQPEVMPKLRHEALRNEEEALQQIVKSLARKAVAGTAGYSDDLATRTAELHAVQAELATYQ